MRINGAVIHRILPAGTINIQELNQCSSYVCRVALAKQLSPVVDEIMEGVVYRSSAFRPDQLKDRLRFNILNLSNAEYGHFVKHLEQDRKAAVKKILKFYQRY